MKRLFLQITNSMLIFIIAGIFYLISWIAVPEERQARASGLSQSELKIWNDLSFQKRFAESYMAETEIEPRVTIEERDRMQKVLGFMFRKSTACAYPCD